jgi:hypothetical protein
MKISERDIERTCTEYLQLDGWRILKTNPCSDKSRGKGFGELGMSDTLAIRYSNCLGGYAEVVWFEWKSEFGILAKRQLSWHLAERARGGITFIAGKDFRASIDGFLEWYRGSGLNRGKV